MTNPDIEKYWNDFLASQPSNSPYHNKTYIAEGFGDNPELADELGQLVLSGVKTGTCSAVWEWEAEGDPIPTVGLISITLDGRGGPICILETTEISIRRFYEVDENFARSEGEGDLTLRYWREAHTNFFSRVLPKFGREFSEDIPLVCERFRVIYQ